MSCSLEECGRSTSAARQNKSFPTVKAIAWLREIALSQIDRLEMNVLLADLVQIPRIHGDSHGSRSSNQQIAEDIAQFEWTLREVCWQNQIEMPVQVHHLWRATSGLSRRGGQRVLQPASKYMCRGHLPHVSDDPNEVETLRLDEIEVKSFVGGLVKGSERKAG
ncbi:hypothetical protein SH661x_002729 [Planctomicrobium sp. SH661]|uniref:hypothetical protein n=1 Tax=Planctomicrobium sp. SH661 TaxID=3448124 RepID=UPI003F5B2152